MSKNRWNDARLLDSLAFDCVLGDWPRALNRVKIQEICNGFPPYSQEEVEENGIVVNSNDLTATRLMHDARQTFTNGFTKTGNAFAVHTDWAAPHKRNFYSSIVTEEANRGIGKSIQFFERQRAKFGMLVLHGISPGVWENQDKVIAQPIAVGDMLIPSNTRLGFENLPFFMIRRSFTGPELQRLTSKEKRDPGWNMGLVKRVLEWVDRNTMELRSTNWGDNWAPERVSERIKEDGGYYMGDQVPTVDCFDIYAYDDSHGEEGWIRRIILDSWGQPQQSGGGYTLSRNTELGDLNTVNDFLFTSGDRKVASNWQQLAAFQFADLSAVFPAKYHSVRSLGWLTYSSCHMGNRMRCKFYEAVFEALMQMFKVNNADDAQRALHLQLINRGFIDESLKPVPAAERWQPNASLIELGINDNQGIIDRNSSSWTQNQDHSKDRTEKTRFQVMAEVNATSALVGAALNQAYQYEVFEDREMFRRLLRKNSTDVMSRRCRENCLRRGVPEKLLNNPEAWEVEHERTMGGGNKTKELQIAQWLMEQREKFDPESQRDILRDSVLAITDDAARSTRYVPEKPVVSDSIHDTELAFGALMIGAQVSVKSGLNAVEVSGRMLQLMQGKIKEVMQSGGVGTPADVQGLARCSAYIQNYLKILGKNPQEKPKVKKLGEILGKLMNEVKAMAQRQQEMAKKQAQAQAQGQNGGMDPKDQAKVKGMLIQAQAKAKIAQDSAAQRTAQRQIQFEQKVKQDSIKHRQGLAQTDLETATNIKNNRLKALSEGPSEGSEE